MEKRDLKADLELCAKLKGIHESQRSHAQTRKLDAIKLPEMTDIASHAIERAIKAEALVREYEEVGFTPEEVMDVVRRFTSFLCEVTGGQMSKPNYTLKDMVAVADDYHQRICDESLQEEIELATKAEEILREVLLMAMWESCSHKHDTEADPTTHCCDWSAVVERIQEALEKDDNVQ